MSDDGARPDGVDRPGARTESRPQLPLVNDSPSQSPEPSGPEVLSAAPVPTRTSWLKRHRLKLFASLVTGGGFVWILHEGALPLWPTHEAFSHVRWWTFGAYIAIWCVVHIIRGARWSLLLTPVHRVPLRKVMTVAWMGFLAISVLPFRAGEVVRPVLIRKKGHLTGWAATGTVGAERVCDGLFLSALLFVALMIATPLDPLPNHIGDLPVPAAVVPGAAYMALLVFAAAFVVMGIFYWRRTWARRMTERIVGLVSRPLAHWLADRVEQVADGLKFLTTPRYTIPFVATTAVYWLLNAAGAWLLAWGCGLTSITFAQACVNIGVLALGILLPNAPGFFGAFQISTYAAFAMYFAPAEVVGAGSVFVLLTYVAQLGVVAVFGVGSMLAERTNLKEFLAAEPVDLETAVQ